IELHTDSIEEGQKIVLVDDVLATGGTTEAAIKLIDRLGGQLCTIIFLLELKDLNGRTKIAKYANNIHSLIEF
ncbi:MAG: phosphoribosyltransferase family protein, partial [Pseudomonadota bacterium]|nr:phosphoribosyltransferase family protein [Pseudomonadota bacterium]